MVYFIILMLLSPFWLAAFFFLRNLILCIFEVRATYGTMYRGKSRLQ